MRNIIIILGLIVAIASNSCKKITRQLNKGSEIHCNQSFDPATWDSCNYTQYTYEDFDIKILDYWELPLVNKAKKIHRKRKYDNDSIPLHTRYGKDSYHPVVFADYGLHLLNVYNNTKSKVALEHLENLSDKMIGVSYHIDSALYFPYVFDFALHGCKEETMMAPWYSGMAQGEILSFYVRFYEQTKEVKYLELARRVYNSFKNLKGNGHKPWIVCIDSSQNLWIEEYPRDLPCFTLNGMVFGIYGLYDYYRVTKNVETEKILKAAITTIKINIHKYRNVNDVSYYCLKHNNFKGKNLHYHTVHINQLKMLYKITGDEYFKSMVTNFEKDKEFFSKEEEL